MPTSLPSVPRVPYLAVDNLAMVLEGVTDRTPERIAMTFEDEAWSYRELDGMASAFGRILAARGLGAGQRVAIMSLNRPEFVVAMFAALKVGASTVMISPAWKRFEVEHAIGLTDPSMVICDSGSRAVLAEVFDEKRLLDFDDPSFATALAAEPGSRIRTDAPGGADAEAVLVFSSGTTGLPKAVRHSHRSFCAAVTHWSSALGMTTDDRFQIATPPTHILGLLNIMSSTLAGASYRIHPRFDIDRILESIEADRITIEMAVAPIALAFADHPDLERFDLSSLRYIMWGATPVTVSVAERVTERSGVPWLPAYGASETPVITCNPVRRPSAWRLDSPGLPIHDLEIRIADLDTGEPLDTGGVGEIQTRSPSAMLGYLPEEANASAWSDGWYRTGDVGYLEPEGWIQITDRVKEMIKVKGFQVAPAEVEAVLHGHPGVADCAVFGIPDDRAGEAVVATVALHPGADVTGGDLQTLVADRLASYKRVQEIRIVDEIPRLPSGKVLRRTLKEQWAPNPDQPPTR